MSNYFFFDPGMTDIDTVIFGPDEKAVQLVSNASKTWCITRDPSIDGINGILREFFNAAPKATVFSVQVYTEDEFRSMWNGEYTDEASDMLDKFEWELIESYMDAEIAERLNSELAPCSNMDFLVAYMKDHMAKFGSDFEIN